MKKVKLSGPGMQEGHVNEISEIFMDISHAEININRKQHKISQRRKWLAQRSIFFLILIFRRAYGGY